MISCSFAFKINYTPSVAATALRHPFKRSFLAVLCSGTATAKSKKIERKKRKKKEMSD